MNLPETRSDTGDQMFAERLQEIAAAWLSKDETWFERSRQRTQLVEFQNQAQPSGGSSGGGKEEARARRDRQLNDAQRQAMGLAKRMACVSIFTPPPG